MDQCQECTGEYERINVTLEHGYAIQCIKESFSQIPCDNTRRIAPHSSNLLWCEFGSAALRHGICHEVVPRRVPPFSSKRIALVLGIRIIRRVAAMETHGLGGGIIASVADMVARLFLIARIITSLYLTDAMERMPLIAGCRG